MTDPAAERPIKDLLGVYDHTESDDPLTRDEALVVLSQLHPADAGRLVRDIGMAMEEGFTVQGSRHPDFQSYVRMTEKEPFNRDGSAPDSSEE